MSRVGKKAERREPEDATHFEFMVALLHIRPRIWRSFLIPIPATFEELHLAIRDSFGWSEEHLWGFREPGRQGRQLAGPRSFGGWAAFDEDMPDARKAKVADYFGMKRRGAKCLYIYDFGDNWEHEVRLQGKASDPKKTRRRLLGGERACPLEDCGGVWGYERIVEFLDTGEDPDGEDPEELNEWIGDWRPDEFDLDRQRKAFDR